MVKLTTSKTIGAEKLLVFLTVLIYPLHKIDFLISSVSWGDVLLIFAVILAMFSADWRRLYISRLHSRMLFLVFSFMFITAIGLLFQDKIDIAGVVLRIARWVLYVIAASLIGLNINFRLLKKWIIIVAELATAILLLQQIVYLLTGVILKFSIRGVTFGAALEGVYVQGNLTGYIWRFSSIFSEPAHFSYFCNLALVLILFYRNDTQWRKSDIVAVVELILGVLVCSSTYGVAMLAVELVWFLARMFSGKRQMLRGVPAIVLVLVLAFVFFARTQYGDYIVYKLQTLTERSRFQFAWNLVGEQSLSEKLLGVGIGNEDYYLENVLHLDTMYLNSLSLTYLYCGWTGMVLFALFFVGALWSERKNNPIVIVLLLLISICSTAFYSEIMVIFTIVYVAGLNNNMDLDSIK